MSLQYDILVKFGLIVLLIYISGWTISASLVYTLELEGQDTKFVKRIMKHFWRWLFIVWFIVLLIILGFQNIKSTRPQSDMGAEQLQQEVLEYNNPPDEEIEQSNIEYEKKKRDELEQRIQREKQQSEEAFNKALKGE